MNEADLELTSHSNPPPQPPPPPPPPPSTPPPPADEEREASLSTTPCQGHLPLEEQSVEAAEQVHQVDGHEVETEEHFQQEGEQQAVEEAEGPGALQEASQKTTSTSQPQPSAPIKASTTGAGEGGQLPEDAAAAYRAKMAEQRRLAKERQAEQER